MTSTLRMLAKAHADGKLDRKDYVKQRRQLIDAIVAESGSGSAAPLPPPVSDLPPSADSARRYTLTEFDATVELPKPLVTANRRRAWWVVGTLAAALVLIGLWLWRSLRP
ncbi:MAG: hypothetical protein HYX63_18775 [Gammaproteobacteria bacterium]|nr:hypothetical protein [Gammaproteobacteria bacterium]